MARLHEPGHITSPHGSRPLVVWDGGCAFCHDWVRRLRRITGDRVDYSPYQDVAARFPEIPPEEFAVAIHLIGTDGSVTTGAEAIFRVLALVPGWKWPLRAYRSVPGMAPLSEWFYRRVALRRHMLACMSPGVHDRLPPRRG